MAEVGAAFSSGLGQGFQQVGNALMNISGINQDRDRRAFERKMAVRNQRLQENREKRLNRQTDLSAFGTRLQAMTQPGVNTQQGMPVGEIGGQQYFYEEPDPQTQMYNVPGMGVELPLDEEGLSTGIGLRRQMGLMGGGGGGGGDTRDDTPSRAQAQGFMERHFSGPEGEPQLAPEREGRFIQMMVEGDPAVSDSLSAAREDIGDGGTGEGGEGGPRLRYDPEQEQYVSVTGQWPTETTEEVTPEEAPRLYQTEKRSLLGVDRLMPDKTTAIPPSDTARVRRQREQQGRLAGPEDGGGGITPGQGTAAGQEDTEDTGRPTDPEGVAIDLMERAGSAEAALRQIRANLGNEDPTPQEQRVIDALEDYAATGD